MVVLPRTNNKIEAMTAVVLTRLLNLKCFSGLISRLPSVNSHGVQAANMSELPKVPRVTTILLCGSPDGKNPANTANRLLKKWSIIGSVRFSVSTIM